MKFAICDWDNEINFHLQVVVDYLRMRQEALTADQMPDDVRRESRVHIEESIMDGKQHTC